MTTSTLSRPPVPDAAPVGDLSARARALLRAVDAGICRLDGADLVVHGRFCSDQLCARRLVTTGLIAPAGPTRRGELAPAVLTAAGREALR